MSPVSSKADTRFHVESSLDMRGTRHASQLPPYELCVALVPALSHGKAGQHDATRIHSLCSSLRYHLIKQSTLAFRYTA